MKLRTWRLILCGLMLITNSSCGIIFQTTGPTSIPPDLTSETHSLATQWQENINLLREWRANLPTPPVMMKGELPDPKPDIMEIFGILDHLKMKDGWVLDYAYNADGMGSYPILYARQDGVAPLSVEELRNLETGQTVPTEQDTVSADYWPYIVPDGSELGYLQLAQLEIMGDQFYLGWHANYNDLTPIATADGLSPIIEDTGEDGFGFTLSDAEKKRPRRST